MKPTLIEKLALNNLSEILYDFLPGQAHPFANQSISFAGVAKNLGLEDFWFGGSKKPAILTLLEKTYSLKRDKFCSLIVEVVNTGIGYRANKTPIKRKEIEEINKVLLSLKFKIPELWSEDFLTLLTDDNKTSRGDEPDVVPWEELNQEFKRIIELPKQKRGYDFERFLARLFESFNLNPKSPFKITGEQIDGSFDIDGNTYLIEAKWQDELTRESDLLIFYGKLEGKAAWSRGLFVSYTGFTNECLLAFSKGKKTNMIGMTGEEIHLILNDKILLTEVIKAKVRQAVETGEFFTHIRRLNFHK
jgi:hypothetical protein